ncbi:MAG TPA: class I SAM-dependent methyltransferase [Chloroflexota bacterium]|nr:class I SAM-dependent methyltransferase [Chloroflexota bacterium]
MNSEALRETQAFFAARAAGWEERFPDDEPRYEQAIAEMGLAPGDSVLDTGCGTGRALPFLRAAAGESARIVALDVTLEMLAQVRRLGRADLALLVQADGERPPFRDASFDAIFAAGYMPHLSEPEGGLRELARLTKPGGRLAIFHPIGRATLAARHGGTPSDDDILAPARLRQLLPAAGWQLGTIDDGPDRYLALARRA